MRKPITVGCMLLVAAAAGCGRAAGNDERALSKREADSVLGASALPGASGITRALTAADSAAARGALLDSLSR